MPGYNDTAVANVSAVAVANNGVVAVINVVAVVNWQKLHFFMLMQL